MTDQADCRSVDETATQASSTGTAAPSTITPQRAAQLATEPVIPEIVAPWLAAAADALDAQLAAAGLAIARSLREDFLSAYRQAIARLTNLAILQRFSSFHLVLDPLWRPIDATPGDAPAGSPRRVLDAYIAWERSERLLADDGPYPELARLVRTAQRQWLNNTRELLERTAIHRTAIATLAGCDAQSLGALTGARFGISDPHHEGRSAAILHYGARRVVYKPRNLEGERAFDTLYGRAVAAALSLPPRPLQIFSASDYGFMEFVDTHNCTARVEFVDTHNRGVEFADTHNCTDTAAATRAYRRYGALAAVAHALGTCDLHHENVIVDGEHPIVIDAEPLFRARLAVSTQGEARLAFERNLSLQGLEVRESILELGLLPLTLRSPLPTDDGDPREELLIGALCAYAQQPMRDLVPCARGSDHVQMRAVQVQADEFPNLPRIAVRLVSPDTQIDAIVDGFERTHAWLRTRRDHCTTELTALRDSRIRLLARPTMDYTAILARSLSPERLRSRDAREAGIRADLAYTAAVRFDTVHDLAARETASLSIGDVPRFELGSEDIHCSGGDDSKSSRRTSTIPGGGNGNENDGNENGNEDTHCSTAGSDAEEYEDTHYSAESESEHTHHSAALLKSPLAAATERWLALDAEDCRLQSTSIRERLLQRERRALALLPRGSDPSALLAHGLGVAELLAAAATRDTDAAPWTFASYAPGFGATMVHADRESLYEGAAGTAVFLAEAAANGGDPQWLALARRTFDPLLRGDVPQSLKRSGGVGRGLGGLLYSLVRVADCSGSDELLILAKRLAATYAREVAAADGLDEVLYGRSGLLLAVLALRTRLGDASLDVVADTIAQQLVARAVRSDDYAYWPTPQGTRFMPNVSHGTAGIAIALARWARARGASIGAELAQAALRYDDTFWLANERGWRDARLDESSSEQLTTWAWCNGRSGALLARHAVAQALDCPFCSDHVHTACTAHESDVVAEVSPGLCCGTAGAIDALLQIDADVPNAFISTLAQRSIVLLAKHTPASQYSTLTPSLFAGTAGLGFALLRAAEPQRVRSMLAFE